MCFTHPTLPNNTTTEGEFGRKGLKDIETFMAYNVMFLQEQLM